MSRKQIVILAALFVFMIAVVVTSIITRKEIGAPIIKPPDETEGIELLETIATSGIPLEYSSEVPENAVVTEPLASVPAATGQGIFGIYPVSITKDRFTPQSITVKKGDVVKLEVQAVDGAYDFSLPGYGGYLSLQQGETKRLSFMPDTEGTFLFECRDVCPANKKIQGTLIVLP